MSTEGSATPQADTLEREANRAHFWLFMVAIVSALSWFVVSGLGMILNKTGLERAAFFCWLPIAFVAVFLARRHAVAIRSDFTIRGRFSSMGSIFGFVFTLSFAVTVPAWESVVWAVGAAAGGWAWHLVRKEKRPKKVRVRG